MKTGDWDYTTLREEEFQQKVNYIAPDTPTAPSEPNRAEASLPRNLVLKPSLNTAFGVWSTDRIPKGTRFGPFVGQIYTKDSVPPDTDRKYFWRVSFYYMRITSNFTHRYRQTVRKVLLCAQFLQRCAK